MLKVYCFFIFVFFILDISCDTDRETRFIKQIKKCLSREQKICIEYEDMMIRFLELFHQTDKIIESKSEFSELLTNTDIRIVDPMLENAFLRAKPVLREHNNFIYFTNLIDYINENNNQIDAYVGYHMNKFIISHNFKISQVKTEQLFNQKITNPKIYVRKEQLKDIYTLFQNLLLRRNFELANLLRETSNEKKKKAAINLLEYLQFFEDENLQDSNSFQQNLDFRIDSADFRSVISEFKNYITDAFESQKLSKNKIYTLLTTKNNINYFKISHHIDRFVDSFGLENKGIHHNHIKCIFHGKFLIDESKKLTEVENLSKYYIDLKIRQKVKDQTLAFIEDDRVDSDTGLDNLLNYLIVTYKIDPLVNTFDELYGSILSSDSIVSKDEIEKIYPKMSTYITKYRGWFLMIRMDSYMKKNKKIDPRRIYDYISSIKKIYNIPNDKNLKYSSFEKIINDKDKIANHKLVKKIFIYFKKHLLFNERTEIKKYIFDNYERRPNSPCLTHSKKLLEFIETYKIKKAEIYSNLLDNSFKLFKKKAEIVDGYLPNHQIESINSILVKCYNFTILKKYREEFANFYKLNPSLKLRGYFSHAEKIMRYYQLKIYDVSNREIFERKINIHDKYSVFSEITNLLKIVGEYTKYHNRKNAISTFITYLATSSSECSRVLDKIETVTTDYWINTGKLSDIENLRYFVEEVDSLFINDQIDIVQPYIEKCIKIMLRKTHLDNVKSKLDKNMAITDFSLKNDIFYLANEYDILNKTINNVRDFIHIIKKHDEIVNTNDILSIYEATKSFNHIFKMNDSLTDASHFLKENEEANFIQMSSHMNRLISICDFKSKDIETINDFRKYIQKMQGFYFEYQISKVYHPLLKYYEYYKRDDLQKRLTKSIISSNTTPIGKFKLVVDAYAFILLYGMKNLQMAEYWEFLKKVTQKDAIINQRQLEYIYNELVKHDKYFENSKTIKTLISIIDKTLIKTTYEKDEEFSKLTLEYSLNDKNIDHFKDFSKHVLDIDHISTEEYLKKIHSHVINFIGRYKVEDDWE